MATKPTVKSEILRGMKEIEAITGMLSNLKKDLKAKEHLLIGMEEQLRQSEGRLEKKINQINDKDKSLQDIEQKVNRRQEELRIQQQELETTAVLEFLTFQAREMEIQKKCEEIPEAIDETGLKEEVESLKKQLQDKDQEMVELRDRPAADGGTVGAAADEALKAQVQSLNEQLHEKNQELEDLRSRPPAASGGEDEGSGEILASLQEREKKLRDLESNIRNKQKEVTDFMRGLQDKEQKIKDLEQELKFKEDLIKMKDDGVASSGDTRQVRTEIDEQYKKRFLVMEGNYQNKIDELAREVDRLRGRNEDLENTGDLLESDKLRVKILERELKDRVNELAFSEERLARRQELMIKERKQIDQQVKSMRSMKDGSQAAEMGEELANRQKQLRDLELKFREKEDYLRRKERELRDMEGKMVDKEITMEMAVESAQETDKVRTGIRRFDDLCYGGLPHSSNFLLFGPAYSGRRTFTNLFIAEGLKKGIPVIYVTTQHTPEEIKNQLRNIIPKVDAYEERGLMKYIDLYSRSMGLKGEYPNTIYVEKTTDLDALQTAMETFQEEIIKKHKHHRMVFFSLSTLLTYIEPLHVFRFFQVLNAKNKRYGCTSINIVDHGMHDPSVIQTMKHVMSGFIDFKLEDLKYHLRLEGGGDVMSRAWIEYSFSDRNFDLRGSFSLDHIR